MITWLPSFPNAGWFGGRFLRVLRRFKTRIKHVDTS